MSEESSSRNEKEMQDEQAASAAEPPFEALRNEGSKDKDALSNDVPQTAQSELSPIARVLVLVPVILTYFLWFLDLAVISTATPAITSEFNSLVDVGWYAWRRSPAIHRCLLTVDLQVWRGVSARQFCIHTADRQALPFVLHKGKLIQDNRTP